jgi:hypothetical protein
MVTNTMAIPSSSFLPVYGGNLPYLTLVKAHVLFRGYTFR